MTQSSYQKLKLACNADFLIRETDEENSVFIKDIQERLAKYRSRSTPRFRETKTAHPSGWAVFVWWRRGELNPCPKTLQRELLRAQTFDAGSLPVPLITGQMSNRWVG